MEKAHKSLAGDMQAFFVTTQLLSHIVREKMYRPREAFILAQGAAEAQPESGRASFRHALLPLQTTHSSEIKLFALALLNRAHRLWSVS